MLQFFLFFCTFHVFDGAAYPYKPNRTIPLDLISHGNEGLFYSRTALSMEICHSTIGIFLQTDLGQEAIRLTAGDGGPSTGCQTDSNA